MADKKFHTSDTSLTNVNISLAQIRSSSKKKTLKTWRKWKREGSFGIYVSEKEYADSFLIILGLVSPRFFHPIKGTWSSNNRLCSGEKKRKYNFTSHNPEFSSVSLVWKFPCVNLPFNWSSQDSAVVISILLSKEKVAFPGVLFSSTLAFVQRAQHSTASISPSSLWISAGIHQKYIIG